MALLLTRKPAETLMLKRPKASHLGLAALLAVAMHPIVATLANGIRTLYPISEQALAKLEQIQQNLEHGCGACFIRGTDLSNLTTEQSQKLFWGLMCHIGTPVSQSADGARIFSVRDEGFKMGDEDRIIL